MSELHLLIPDPQQVSEMQTADLAGYVLEVLLMTKRDEGLWNRGNFLSDVGRGYVQRGDPSHDGAMLACAEAWGWLEVNQLICPHPENGHDGWYIATRRAKHVRDRQGLATLIANAELPEHFLHPEVVRHARPLFMQNRLDTAVFEAFKALEVEIRQAAGLGNDLVGVQLANRAFHPKDGPLTDPNAEMGEREALRNLVTGALGSYKNPSSHRRVALTTAEAREMLILASHLLNIVDSRRPRS